MADRINTLWQVPALTLPRTVLALVIAVAADGLQLLLGVLGWEGPDQIIDLAAMILVSRVIGFHVLLLPTFIVELVPLLDDLPTWTACTTAVIALRKREQSRSVSPITPPDKPIIDV